MTTMKNFKVSAIICAAGRGERAGFDKNKLLAPLYGAPALYHTLKKFDIPEIDEVVVTSSKNDLKEISAIAKPFGYRVIVGGATRTDSVKRALTAVTGDIVIIHDGARPFVKKELILSCIDSVLRFGSGVCALPLTDTVAQVSYGRIISVPDREEYRKLQTPQAFFTADIRSAYTLAGKKKYTDDSSVYAEFISSPALVDGDGENIKLTYREDFERGLPPKVTPAGQRVGFGVDTHAFGEGDSVTLAGVKIACDRGLIAHSDGDVILHALSDALLSAAGLKDIGHYFPDTDPAYKNADSGELLKTVLAAVKDAGFVPMNISISVQAEKPRLAANIDKMCLNIAEISGLPRESVAIAAGTSEKLGFVGEGLGITAYASVLLNKAK